MGKLGMLRKRRVTKLKTDMLMLVLLKLPDNLKELIAMKTQKVTISINVLKNNGYLRNLINLVPTNDEVNNLLD